MDTVDRILARKDDIYYVLNLSASTTSQDDIKRAFRRLALSVHPDKHVDKSNFEQERVREAFNAVKVAQDILLDSKKLYAYKKGGITEVNNLEKFGDFSLLRILEVISLKIAKYGFKNDLFVNKSREEVEYWKAKRKFEEEEDRRACECKSGEYNRASFNQPQPPSQPLFGDRETMKDFRTKTPNVPHDIFWRRNKKIMLLVLSWIILLLSLELVVFMMFHRSDSGDDKDTTLNYYLKIRMPLYDGEQYPHVGYYSNLTYIHINDTTKNMTHSLPTGCSRLWRRQGIISRDTIIKEQIYRNHKYLPPYHIRDKTGKKRRKTKGKKCHP